MDLFDRRRAVSFYSGGKAERASNSRSEDSRDDWKTPREVIGLVERIFGSRIGLDPCASMDGNDHFAQENFTIREDGLIRPWNAKTVFINPPYGRATRQWVDHGVVQAKRFGSSQVWLVAVRLETRWFRTLSDFAAMFAVMNQRLKFQGATDPAAFASALVLLTEDKEINDRFRKETNGIAYCYRKV